jgi:GMP synthase PP-ATPase subunit
MTRKTRRIKRAAKRKAQTAAQQAIIAQIDTVVRPLGCRLVGIGPGAVGVQGDARTYGISVVIRFPEAVSAEHASHVSTLITNRVSAVTRVLQDIPL